MPAPAELRARAARIRFPVTEIAASAGLHIDTVHQCLNEGADSRASTIVKVDRALEAEERALLAHLVGLYPTHALLLASDGPRREAAE